MSTPRASGPEPGDLVREDGSGSATVRQLGGFLLVAAVILAVVRLVRGSRGSGRSRVRVAPPDGERD